MVNEVYGVAEIDFNILQSILEEENFKIDKYFRDRLKRVLRNLVSKKELALIEIPIDKYKDWLKENNKEDWIKKLDLENYNKGFIFCGVIDDIVLSEDKRKIIVRFNRFITPMILKLRKRFTVYELKYILLLTTQYGPPLYELLKKNEFLGNFRIKVEELKKYLGADTPGYKYWTQFYERVLKPAIEDINTKTDIYVQIKPIMGAHGKVTEVEFLIKPKKYLKGISSFKEIILEIVKSFQKAGENITVQEFAEVLLSLKRVNPAVALWFLLHYPEGESRLYAWQHVRFTDQNLEIKHPDRFLESLIKDKKLELGWLLDQRTKDFIYRELEKIAREGGEEKEDLNSLVEEIVSKAKHLDKKRQQKLKQILKVKSFKDFLSELVAKKNAEKLKEISELIDNLLDRQLKEFEEEN